MRNFINYMKTDNQKIMVSAALGSAVEFYDFSLYGYFATIIAQLFFPHFNHYISLIYTFGVFAAGYITRPFGGIIFSHLADKYGRKKVFITSLTMMALSTFAMGMLPTYQSIGILAPVLLIVVRLIQGISVSGEITSSIVFLVEHADATKKGLISSATFIGIAMGMLLASLISIALSQLLTHEVLIRDGWRIAFLFGIILAVVGVYIRTHINETAPFLALKHSGMVLQFPLIDAIKNHGNAILITFITTSLASVVFYISFIYMSTYLSSAHYTLTEAITLTSFGLTIYIIALPFTALASDRYGKRVIILIFSLMLALMAYPVFLVLSLTQNILLALITQFVLSILAAGCIGPMPAFWVELFPIKNRASGFSIGYNAAVTLLGGFSPLLAAWLTKNTGIQQSASFLIILPSIATLVVLYYQQRR